MKKKRCLGGRSHDTVSNQCRRCGIFKRGSPERRIADFWAKVDRNGPAHPHRPELGNCWIWIGAKTSHGYGEYLFQGRVRHAHQVAYFLEHGAYPDGLADMRNVHRHTCDRKACVRSSHLIVSSQKENMADVLARGGRKNVLHPNTVASVRAFGKSGLPPRAIARIIGASISVVRRILSGRTWKSLGTASNG